MSFEWQDHDEAARTLGVDVPTLQAWIDAGRAPSRALQGRVQVLIELLDESAPAADTPPPSSQPSSPASTGPATHAAASAAGGAVHAHAGGAADATTNTHHADSLHDAAGAGPQRVTAATTEVDVVARRELQLAGGMIAAWQQLAETANDNLARTRRLGALSWSIVAVLVVLGGAGLWASTRAVTETQGRLNSTEEKLKLADRNLLDDRNRLTALDAELRQRTTDLTEAHGKFTAAMERADLSKAQADQLAAQHALTKQLADRQAETARSLATLLEATIEQQRKQIASLEKSLADTQAGLKDAESRLAAAQEKARSDAAASAKEIETQRAAADAAGKQKESLQKQLDDARSQQTKTAAELAGLQKQMRELKEELEKIRSAAPPPAPAKPPATQEAKKPNT